jgi:DNA-binding response OmpR family regulator
MEEQQQQKILIVDKDERVLRVMDSFLANAGFDTRTASDRNVALDLLHSQVCDLVLVADHFADFSVDGFFDELQRLPTGPSVIVMESGPGRSWNAGLYTSFGASARVDKWRPCEVLAAVNDVLSSVRVNKH